MGGKCLWNIESRIWTRTLNNIYIFVCFKAYFYKFSIIIFFRGCHTRLTFNIYLIQNYIYVKRKRKSFLVQSYLLITEFCMYQWIGFIFLRIFIFFSFLLLFFLFSLFYKKKKKKNLYIRVLYSRSIKFWMYIIEKRKEIDRWAKKAIHWTI